MHARVDALSPRDELVELLDRHRLTDLPVVDPYGRLIGAAIFDRGSNCLSAVYCYYDPAESKRSIGVFSILAQVEICRRWELDYLYLGFYVAGCNHMNYKSAYKPHERLIDGEWKRFDR